MNEVRLQKYLAQCGVASRRASEKLISSGRVKINGKIVTEMGVKTNPILDNVLVDNKPVKIELKKIYILLNKPLGVITSVSDEMNRKTVIDLINIKERIYPVGRLDYYTSGALLLTNDGDVAYNLTHPSKGVWKKYLVDIEGFVDNKSLSSLENGITLDDGVTAPAKCDLIFRTKQKSRLELSIHEGRNRQIRRMFEQLNKKILKLKRVQFGPLNLNNLDEGSWRYLTDKEIEKIVSVK